MRPNLFRRFRDSKQGNVAMTFGLAAIPIIALVGMGLDYSQAGRREAQLNAIADAAALSTATPTAITQAWSTAQKNATDMFNAEANSVPGVNVTAVNVDVEPHTPSTSRNTTVTYTATSQNAFASLLNMNSITIGGKATAAVAAGSYIDFYLVLDVSGSMGIPTTDQGQTQLAGLNPDNKQLYPTGCVFACHYPGSQGFGIAKNNNIALRIDTVGSAVSSLIQTAMNTRTVSNQYRIGIYPFVVHAVQEAALSSNFTAATNVANNFSNYLDKGDGGNGEGSGGTHFENLAWDMPKYFSTIGDGSSATSPKPFVFLVTDGADNNQTYSPFSGSQPQVPDLSFCSNAKASGITISILYIPYVPIQNPNHSFAGDEDGKVNAIIPQLSSNLQSCSSPGFFFTASTPQDIQAAMQAMFAQAVRSAHLTQ